jgi:hypothetical protein
MKVSYIAWSIIGVMTCLFTGIFIGYIDGKESQKNISNKWKEFALKSSETNNFYYKTCDSLITVNHAMRRRQSDDSLIIQSLTDNLVRISIIRCYEKQFQ